MAEAFDHLEPGTAESAWSRDRRLARLPRWDAPGEHDHLLVVAAHPDDETLGAGGLIATAAARGATVDVLVATNGEASHPASPTHTAGELAAIRRLEVRAAVAELDPIASVTMLDLPDGHLDRAERSITIAVAARLSARTLVVTPWADDRHPDHEACARAAHAALHPGHRHWQYPIWLWHWGDPDGPHLPWDRAGAVDLEPAARAAKRRALARHRSQHEPLSGQAGDEAILPPAFVAHFARDYETFLLFSTSGSAPSA